MEDILNSYVGIYVVSCYFIVAFLQSIYLAKGVRNKYDFSMLMKLILSPILVPIAFVVVIMETYNGKS